MSITKTNNDIQEKSIIFAEVMSVCSGLLKNNKLAENEKKYLLSRVNSFNESGFTFGYWPNQSLFNILTEFIEEEKLIKVGLAYKKQVDLGGYLQEKLINIMPNHNLIMPYKNLYGDIIGIVGRTLLSSEQQSEQKISKYKNTSLNKSLNLFGLYNAKKHILEKDYVIIVEGQFDCITCHRFGYKNTVALGSASLSKYQFYLLKRYTNNLYLMLDNDSAGIKSTEKIYSRYSSLCNLKQIKVDSSYKDIDLMLMNDSKSLERLLI